MVLNFKNIKVFYSQIDFELNEILLKDSEIMF